ncbi:MAG: class I SAM-dependent methyltransferase [Acidimicrobiales bacterium]
MLIPRLIRLHAVQQKVDRVEELLRLARSATGFFPEEEAAALYRLARRAVNIGPIVEIGAYLGRSTLFLAAAAAAERRGVVFSVDHHRGSEEMQQGWPDHDPSLVDPLSGKMDSLARFRAAIKGARAQDLVITVVGNSARVASSWSSPAGLVFIDGGHGEDVCWADYQGWAPHVAPSGFLAFHDVFPDPEDGGRPPFECFEDAVCSGRFLEDVEAGNGSLRVVLRPPIR